jgi:predicted metal-dependent hydrolase
MDYIVEYTARKKITLIIERDNSLIVRAPLQATQDELDSFIKRKRVRIYKKLAEKKYMNFTELKKQFVNGEGFLYLGRSYKLVLVDEQDTPLLFRNNRFYLRKDCVDEWERHFIYWYIAKGSGKIMERMNHFQKKIWRTGVWGWVKDLQYRRWSCTPSNKLYFHRKTMMAPWDVIDYIIAHELVHIVEKKHTKKFWDMMSLTMPWYEKHKEWLKIHWGDLVL